MPTPLFFLALTVGVLALSSSSGKISPSSPTLGDFPNILFLPVKLVLLPPPKRLNRFLVAANVPEMSERNEGRGDVRPRRSGDVVRGCARCWRTYVCSTMSQLTASAAGSGFSPQM